VRMHAVLAYLFTIPRTVPHPWSQRELVCRRFPCWTLRGEEKASYWYEQRERKGAHTFRRTYTLPCPTCCQSCGLRPRVADCVAQGPSIVSKFQRPATVRHTTEVSQSLLRPSSNPTKECAEHVTNRSLLPSASQTPALHHTPAAPRFIQRYRRWPLSALLSVGA
jgi:hypothetical protein